MGVHVAGTQHGHTYYLGPLEGTRAPALIALRSRAPAAHVQFWPLQHTIWQIEAGLSYNDMSAESQQLIDSLIPDYKNLLREEFLKSLQKVCSGVRGRMLGSACDEIRALTERYQQAQQTLQRYANNNEALAQQIVHVLPGTYPNPGPASWSRLNSRVYARVAGGHIWQETSTLEIRVLPSSGAGYMSTNSIQGATLRNAGYSPNGGMDPARTPENDTADVPLGNDTADVPLGAVITYPDAGAGVQVLGPELESGGGQATPPTSGPAVASSAPSNLPPQPNPVPESAINPASNQVPISEPAGAKSSFTTDTVLDPAHWQTATALLARLAQAEGTRWVQSQLSFDQPGMKISGVNGEHQFTGVQSKANFTVPFSVRATVMGTIANGNPFSFYIVSDDLRQSLRIDGNLNPQNGEYYGLGIRLGNSQEFKVLRNVGVGQWYTLVVALDANGVGAVTIEDSKGTILATKTDLAVGLGPFFMVLGQREGSPFTVGANEAVWSSVELIPDAASTPSSSASAPSVVQAAIRAGGTSLELPPGQMYLYGMSTGGGAPSSQFTAGQYADAVNAAGHLSDALAYGTNSQNSYTTQTAYHDIGGVSVAGSWEHFAAYYGSNHQSGAHDASVSFQTNEDSLVVVFGLASSQQFVSVEGIPNLQVDASKTGGGIVIAHANVKPGTYNVVEHSKVLAAGQDQAHMADLVGVFVFGGKQANPPPAVISEQPHTASIQGAAAAGNIRSVDFRNFSYESECSEKVDPGFGKIIPATNGSWKKGSLESGDSLSFSVVKVSYGDVKGDGQVEAIVHTACLPPANWDYEELSVFEMSGEAPRLLARFTPGEGLADHGPRYDVVKADGGELSVSYQVTGEHGSGACPEWTVTERFRWNGSRFVSTGQSRRKNSCAQ